MRIILDYLYATWISGFVATVILVIAITLLVLKVYPFSDFDALPGNKKLFYRLFLLCSAAICVLLFAQMSVNPFNFGRAGAITQAAIMKKAIVFTDSPATAEGEALTRIWVLDRKTGSLKMRKTVQGADPILGAGETSLLIGVEGTCELTDDRLKTTTRYIERDRYHGRDVHRYTFRSGALLLTFRDFSESRVPLPFITRRDAIKTDISVTRGDGDAGSYRITRRINNRVTWQVDGSWPLREQAPALLYEYPYNDLYLLWTEDRLVALSKKTGKVVWTFRY